MVCVADVGGDYVSGDVANGADVADATCPQAELSRTPEVSLTKMSAKPGMLAEDAVSASAFEELKCAGHTHSGWKSHKQMYVVGFDLQLKYYHSMQQRDFAQKLLAVLADQRKLERIHRILGLCLRACPSGTHQVEHVLTYSVAMRYQTFHFSSPSARKFCTAHANLTVRSGCANYAAHPLLRTSVENKEVISKVSGRYLVRNSSAA